MKYLKRTFVSINDLKAVSCLVALVLLNHIAMQANAPDHVTSKNPSASQADTAHTIAFFSSPNNTTTDNHFFDKLFMDTIRKMGYRVDHIYTTDDCMSQEKLNRYNLIIIGRGSRSGHFADPQFWSEIKAPILCLSGYMVFPNFFNLIGSGQLQGPNGELSDIDTNVVQYVNVTAPEDASFQNISLDGNKMPYNTWIYDFIDYDSASFIVENNGQLLATYTGLGPDLGNSRVAMARWNPGVQTYENGVVPKGYRTYMQMGTDNDRSPVILNHLQFTPESYKVFKNEIAYLISMYQDSVSLTEMPSCSDARIRQLVFNNQLVLNINYTGSSTIHVNLDSQELKDAEPDIIMVDADATVSNMYYDSLNRYLVIETLAGDDVTSLEYHIYPENDDD